jgi:hypothetical protein
MARRRRSARDSSALRSLGSTGVAAGWAPQRKWDPDLGKQWGGEDSNLRPTDYESGNKEGADLQEFMNLLIRSIT